MTRNYAESRLTAERLKALPYVPEESSTVSLFSPNALGTAEKYQ